MGDVERSVAIVGTFVDNMSAPAAAAFGGVGSSMAGMAAAANSSQAMMGSLLSSTVNTTEAMATGMSAASDSTQATMGLLLTSTVNTMGMGATGGATGGGILGAIGGAVTGVKDYVTGLVEHMRWASLFVGMAVVGVVKNIIDMTASVEQSKVAFTTLLQSPEKAGDLLSWLTKISLQTPQTRQQLTDTARTFLAYGETLDETKIAVMAVADATSALGINQTRLNTITYNLGQLYNSTTGSYRQLRDLQKEGISTSELLAMAVNDGLLKLNGYGSAATGAAGPTKALTNAYDAASGNLRILTDKLKKAQIGLDDYNKQSKKTEEGTLSHKIAVEVAQKALDKANGTIAQYNSAMTSSAGITATAATALTNLNREQEDAILKQNEGKDVAIALEKEMEKLYAGAALRQVKTLTGLISNFGDVMQYVWQRAVGISLEGVVQVGGAFDRIRNALANFVNYLIDHIDVISNFMNQLLSQKEVLIGIAAFIGGTFLASIISIIAPVLLLGVGIGILAGLASKLFDSLGGVNGVSREFQIIWATIGPEVTKFADDVEVRLGPALKNIKIVIDDVWKFIQDHVKGLEVIFGPFILGFAVSWENFKLVVKVVLDAIGGNWKAVWQDLKDYYANIWKDINKTTDGALNQMWVTILRKLNDIGDWFQKKFEEIRKTIDSFKGNGVQMMVDFFDNLNKTMETYMRTTMEKWGRDWEKLVSDAGDQLDKFVTKTLPDWLGNVVKWLGTLPSQFGKAMDQVGKAISDWFDNMGKTQDPHTKKAADDMIKSVEDGVALHQMELFRKLADAIALCLILLIPLIIVGFTDIGSQIITSISKGLEKDKDKLLTSVRKLAEDITNALKTIKMPHLSVGTGSGTALGQKVNYPTLDVNWYQHGGIVAGPIGAPVPIVAHGGETITPLGGQSKTGQQANINININGSFVLDSPERINDLAKRISSILGRQMELSYLGSGW